MHPSFPIYVSLPPLSNIYPSFPLFLSDKHRSNDSSRPKSRDSMTPRGDYRALGPEKTDSRANGAFATPSRSLKLSSQAFTLSVTSLPSSQHTSRSTAEQASNGDSLRDCDEIIKEERERGCEEEIQLEEEKDGCAAECCKEGEKCIAENRQLTPILTKAEDERNAQRSPSESLPEQSSDDDFWSLAAKLKKERKKEGL